MDEIQRYYSPNTMIPALPEQGGIVVYKDHLADKTAALEAKDAHYATVIKQDQKQWAAKLEAQAEEHQRDMHSLETRMNWDRAAAIAHLNTKHTKELAEARGEGEPVLKLLRRVHRKISFPHDQGCYHICARCKEKWPCETAVIAGIE